MKRLRVPVRGLHAGLFVGSDAVFHYVTRVHRLREGDPVTLFDPEQRLEADATLTAIERDRVSFTITALTPGRVLAERTVRVVQGLPKGDKLDAIVRDATELGASELWLCETERAVATAPEPGRLAKKLARLERIAEEAARQSGRVDVPALLPPRSLAECIAADTSDVRVLLTPGGSEAAGSVLRADGSVSLYVGPEGGFGEAEIAHARTAGVVVAHLGPFVLRTETVVAAVLGALRLLQG